MLTKGEAMRAVRGIFRLVSSLGLLVGGDWDAMGSLSEFCTAELHSAMVRRLSKCNRGDLCARLYVSRLFVFGNVLSPPP